MPGEVLKPHETTKEMLKARYSKWIIIPNIPTLGGKLLNMFQTTNQ